MSLEPKRIKKAAFSSPPPAEEEIDNAILCCEDSRGVFHHDIFIYPPKPKPNPALAPFFEKLEGIRKQLSDNNS